MKFYFEFVPSLLVDAPPQYLVTSYEQLNNFSNRQKLMHTANRVWGEDNGKVHYVKNRYRPTSDPVDMKEFVWIKLRSVPYE
jgi:hypothetical protein